MKSERIKMLLVGVLIGSNLTGVVALAKQSTVMAELIYRDIKLYVDGVLIEPEDSNGTKVEPFIYNGTTYLPVRAVGEAVDKQVTWDGNTNSVYLGEAPVQAQYLMEVAPPYAGHYEEYLSNEGESFEMGGEKYTNGITFLYDNTGEAYFNLNGKYNTLKVTLGNYDVTEYEDTIAFVVDGKTVAEYTIVGTELPIDIEVPLNYGLQLKIILTEGQRVGLGNMIVE